MENNLEVIRSRVLAHMDAPDEVSLEPALEAMSSIEPGDSPDCWMVLGTIRYFFYLRRWNFDDPAYGVVLDKFYSAGVASWTGAEYRTKTAEAVAAWYKYDFPAVVYKAEEPMERKPAKHSKKKKYAEHRASDEGHDDYQHEAEETKRSAPKDDGLEKRMAKRIAKQRG